MGFNIGNMSSMVGGLTNNINLSSLTNGIDISSITPESLGGVKDTIQTNIGNMASQLQSNIGNITEQMDFESMINNLDIEGKVSQMMNQSGMNSNIDIESMTNQMMSQNNLDPNSMDMSSFGNFDQSQIESMINEMTNGISDGMGLDSITHM
jgi:pyruvoyl-dependent arginine decarboxylase (PvlArgDC)